MGELPVPHVKSSSLDLRPSCINRLKSSTWLPRGNFRGRRLDQVRRGTGMAVASNIDATADGICRSLEDDEEDRREVREVADVLDGVRGRASRRNGGREARFDGMPTGLVLTDPS